MGMTHTPSCPRAGGEVFRVKSGCFQGVFGVCIRLISILLQDKTGETGVFLQKLLLLSAKTF